MTSYQLKTQSIYSGDCLKMLKDIPDESVDLIYLDPPFNSNRNYEVFWGDVQEKRAFADRFGDAEAYINYMRPRVMELYRVLKKTGSFYYHCDWHASHYVKIMLDQIFSFGNFRNEIIWKRKTGRGETQHKSHEFGVSTESIFFYTKTRKNIFNSQYTFDAIGYDDYIAKAYKYVDENGRRYQSDNLASPSPRPNLIYEYKGYKPPKNGWAISKEKMKEWDKEGRIIFPKNKEGRIRRKRYLDELKGKPVQNLWDDIQPISSHSAERLGYPTQKPISLLERIINASSNKGDVILDAFCGCGTTLIAAHKLGRKWIGIDISPTACRVMSQRLYDLYKLKEGKDFEVYDLPKSEEELRMLPHFEFQNWAVIALGQLTNTTGVPNVIKTGDFGIDGRLYPIEIEKKKKEGKDLFGEHDKYYPVQVKQMDKAGRPDIDNFVSAIRRDGRDKGYFVAFGYSKDAVKEVKRLWKVGEVDINLIEVSSLLKAESMSK